jgi:ATP-binding cassette subfamily B protein
MERPVEDMLSRLDDVRILQFLPPEARKLMGQCFVPVSFGFGDLVVREGEEADAFYVLVSGHARVVKQTSAGEVVLNVVRPGDSFGEMALLENTRRTATVRASDDTHALKLDRAAFDALVGVNPEIRHYVELQVRYRHLNDFFRLYSAFARLPAEGLRRMLEELEPTPVAAGEVVVRQGDAPGPMYVVEEGRLRVFTEEDGRRRYLAYLRKGDFFGELSIFKGLPRAATVEAVTACRLARFGEAGYRKLLAGYPEFRARIEERVAQYDYKHVARVPLDFAEEVLPADVAAHEKVGPDQLTGPDEDAADGGRWWTSAGRRPIRGFPLVRQLDETDCGAACLAMVCRHHGRAVSLAHLRRLVHTSLDGTSLKALCRAAEELGLAARAVKSSAERLDRLPLPAIVHWEGNHWVVLYAVDRRWVRVADPAGGRRRLSREEFERNWSGYAALFDYTIVFESAPIGRASLAWLWPFFRPFSSVLVKAFALALVVSGLQMLLPVATQLVVDRVLVDRDVGLLHLLALSMGVVWLFMTLAVIVQRYLLSFVTTRIDVSTLDFLTRRLLALPLTYFTSRRTGDIQRRLGGVRQLRAFLVQNGIGGLTAVVQFGAALCLMALYSPFLTVVFLATTPLYVGLMHVSARLLRPIFDRLEEGFGRYHSHQIDAIRGIETVKALGAEGGFRQRMLEEFHLIADRQFKADLTITCYEGAVQTVTFLSATLFLWAGARQVMDGGLTLGGLMAFNSLVALANAPIAVLLSIWDSLQFASVLLDRLNDVFEAAPEQGPDHGHLRPVRTLEGRIQFENVGFRYGGPEAPAILQGITLEVPAGRTVAIVGRSGSGKTTLVKCLAGLLEPSEGTIQYDGVDLKTLRYRELRQQIGFVLQETHLFAGTIAANIALADDEPDMDRVLWAARVANAHEFIERLPLGYETKIGETGLALAGGQRQRIAIARAVYGRPPVLVFDEATSNLDSESERAIKESMDQLLKGRTAFVIAHRLSTVRDADLIIVLDKGRLVERGTHDELMKREGLYYYLCSQQLAL